MGYVLFTARKLMLTSRLNDLNFKEMLISMDRMKLLDDQLQLQLNGKGADANASQLEAIKTKETMFDLQMKAYDTQIKAIQQELESVEKAEDQAIKDSAPKYGQG